MLRPLLRNTKAYLKSKWLNIIAYLVLGPLITDTYKPTELKTKSNIEQSFKWTMRKENFKQQ